MSELHPRGYKTLRPKRETRVDKYGQCFRLVCSCGHATNWHTEWWKAEDVFSNTRCEDLQLIHQKKVV